MREAKSGWAASMEACGKSLRRAWDAREIDDGSSERPRHYIVSFDASPSTAGRVKQFIADQPTSNRSLRSYEVGPTETRR